MFRLAGSVPAVPLCGGSPPGVRPGEANSNAGEKPAVKEAATLQPLKWWGQAGILIFLLFFLFLRIIFPATFGRQIPAE